MNRRQLARTAFAPLALGLLGAAAGAQGVGSQMLDEVDLDDLTQTGAKSFDDFTGRAVLIEFFAYW